MGITTIRTRPKPGEVQRPNKEDPFEQKVVDELRRRYRQWETIDNEFLKRADFELDFLGNHWLEEETGKDKREDMLTRGRSAFSIDLLTPSMDVIINTARVNKVTANFIPVSGDDASEATAEVRQGLYRNIERASKGFIVRETAFQFAVSVGRGYERVVIEDEEGASFLRRIGLRRVINLHGVALDLGGVNFGYTDMSWCFFWEDMDAGEYRARFEKEANPDTGDEAFAVDITGLSLEEVDRALWFPNGKVRYGEYFRKRFEMRRVVEYRDPETQALGSCWIDELQPGQQVTGRYMDKLDWYIEWRRMSGTQTLEKMVWPGKYIPLVVYIGREQFRGKKPRIDTGLIRPAIDPSRIHDAMFSRMVDEVGFSPLPHMLAATGQLGVEQKRIVAEINRNAWAVVEYMPAEDKDGRQLQPPAWLSPGVNAQAVVQAAELAANKLDRVLSVYAPQRGQPVGDMSGRAMREVKDQGDLSHAAFSDNYARAIDQEALIINDLMDAVYTEEQLITILQPDEKTKQVLINQVFVDPDTGKPTKHVFGGNNRYAAAVQIGSSYPNQMAQASEQLLNLAKIWPQELAKTIDLIVKGLNIPNSQAISERLGFSQKDGKSPDQLRQENMQLQQLNQQAHGLIENLLDKVKELGSAEAIRRLEIASKERIAAGNNLTTLIGSELKAGQAATHEVLLKQLELIVTALNQSEDKVEGQQQASQLANAQLPAQPSQAFNGHLPPGLPPGVPPGLPAGMPPALPQAAPPQPGA